GSDVPWHAWRWRSSDRQFQRRRWQRPCRVPELIRPGLFGIISGRQSPEVGPSLTQPQLAVCVVGAAGQQRHYYNRFKLISLRRPLEFSNVRGLLMPAAALVLLEWGRAQTRNHEMKIKGSAAIFPWSCALPGHDVPVAPAPAYECAQCAT